MLNGEGVKHNVKFVNGKFMERSLIAWKIKQQLSNGQPQISCKINQLEPRQKVRLLIKKTKCIQLCFVFIS